jgi:hypothetical protein
MKIADLVLKSFIFNIHSGYFRSSPSAGLLTHIAKEAVKKPTGSGRDASGTIICSSGVILTEDSSGFVVFLLT